MASDFSPSNNPGKLDAAYKPRHPVSSYHDIHRALSAPTRRAQSWDAFFYTADNALLIRLKVWHKNIRAVSGGNIMIKLAFLLAVPVGSLLSVTSAHAMTGSLAARFLEGGERILQRSLPALASTSSRRFEVMGGNTAIALKRPTVRPPATGGLKEEDAVLSTVTTLGSATVPPAPLLPSTSRLSPPAPKGFYAPPPTRSLMGRRCPDTLADRLKGSGEGVLTHIMRRGFSTGVTSDRIMRQRHYLIIDETLALQLVRRQFPQWGNLPIKAVERGGWDNKTFRLGNDMLVRMPRSAAYKDQVEKEQKWLPKLAPRLPLAIPRPLGLGMPDYGYPWKWSIYRWIEGDTAAVAPIGDMDDFAARLARFIHALQSIDTKGAPHPTYGNFSYIGGLWAYDGEVRRAVAALEGKIDATSAIALWEKACKTSWHGEPVWVHGDLSAGNLLVQEERLCAAIDFGGLAVGDPACDLVITWKFLQGKSREKFRRMLPYDDGTWARARAWALWKAMVVAARFIRTNPVEAAHPWRTIEEVIKDYKGER